MSAEEQQWNAPPNPAAALVGLWGGEAACPGLWSFSLEKTDSAK